MSKIISYHNVSVNQAEQIVLRDVNLNIHSGEVVYLLGKVGTGKSTFMKSLYGEVPIAAGQAQVLDYDMCKIRRRKLPCHIKNGIVEPALRDQPVPSEQEFLIYMRKNRVLKAEQGN